MGRVQVVEMSDRKREEERRSGTVLQERYEEKLEKPRQYKVLIHNDDYTPMEWVVALLRHVFRKNDSEATRIMLQVHMTGIGLAGVYTHEIAETKVATALQFAEKDEYPLMCSMEPEE